MQHRRKILRRNELSPVVGPYRYDASQVFRADNRERERLEHRGEWKVGGGGEGDGEMD